MHSNALSHALHRMPKMVSNHAALYITISFVLELYIYLIYIYMFLIRYHLPFDICMDVSGFNSAILRVPYPHFTYMDIVLRWSYSMTALISYIELFSLI